MDKENIDIEAKTGEEHWAYNLAKAANDAHNLGCTEEQLKSWVKLISIISN